MNLIKKILKRNTSNNTYHNKQLFKSLKQNIDYIKSTLGNSYDLLVRELVLKNNQQQLKIGVLYIVGLVDELLINETIMNTIPNNFKEVNNDFTSHNEIYDYFNNIILTYSGVNKIVNYIELFDNLLSGNTIILLDNINKAFSMSTIKYRERNIDKPMTDISVKGSKDAFIENLLTNVSSVRRLVKNPNLWTKKYIIGKHSNTNVVIMYLKGVADDSLVNEVKSRIEKIQADNILDSSYFKHYLREKNFSIFPLLYDTERPDIAAANIFEGRVLIFSDYSPFVIIAPSNFFQRIHAVDDFYQNAIIASFFRLIRLLAFFLSIFLPAIYLCLVFSHPELIPINLLFSIAGQRLELPFPTYIELLGMAIIFDILREAGARMPAALGPALSFLGAIIIGQASVEAGLISYIIVIIITVTAICSLAIPDYDLNLTVTVLRYVFIIIASFLGLYGITIGAIILLAHMTSLKSFGVPYLAPIAPFNKQGIKDSIIRAPINKLFKTKKNINEKYPN